MAITTNRRSVLGGALAAGLASPILSQTASARMEFALEELPLWPGDAPGMPDPQPTEVIDIPQEGSPRRRLSGIAIPRMLVVRPAQPNGAAMLLMPGGGYRVLSVDNEGHSSARALAELGITAFILLYRLPSEGWAQRESVPLADAQRAMRLIRHRFPDLDPERVGAMGFSAGGHLCASLGTMFARETYTPVDEADLLSARPTCAAPIYPVVSMDAPFTHAGSRRALLGEDAPAAMRERWSPERNVPEDAPPHFLLHAEDDRVTAAEDSLLLRAALKAREIPVETHLLTRGGHGFGGNPPASSPAAGWISLWHRWAMRSGMQV